MSTGLGGCCSLEDSYLFARQITAASGSNFRYSFYLLNRRQFRAMCVLYAFLRITDDLSDSVTDKTNENSPTSRRNLLRDWRESLQGCLQNKIATHPIHPSLRQIVEEFSIQQTWLEAVIDGMEADLQHRPFETAAELQTYCYQVAGVVGLCCQAIWGSNLNETSELAITCGEAFQRTNILRDLREDFLQQRLYLPREIWKQHQLQPEILLSAPDSVSLREMLELEIAKTDQLYATASRLDRLITGPGQRMFRVMFQTYRQLLHQLADQRNSGWPQQKTGLNQRQKLKIFLSAPFRKLR